MTVLVDDTVERYTVAGVGPYAFSFRIFDATDLQVTACSTATPPVPTLLTYLSDYTVDDVNDSDGGTVTLVSGREVTYAGYTLDIRSVTPNEQPTSIRNQGRFLPEVHEDAFDYLARQIQDIRRQQRACVRYPDNVLNDGMMTPLSGWLSKYLAINANGVLEAAALSSTAITASIITTLLTSSTAEQDVLVGLILGRSDNVPVLADRVRTLAEIAAGVTPVNYGHRPYTAPRYGAIDDSGTTDNTVALQTLLNVALYSGVAYIPSILGGYYKVTDRLILPNRGSGKGLVVYGDGRVATRILQVTAAKDIFDTNNIWSTTMNNVVIRDMSLEGSGLGRYGIRCVAMSRSQFLSLNILNFATAGFYIEDSIVNEIDGCHIIGNQDGIVQTAAPNSVPNSWRLTNSILASNTRYGVNLLNGSGWEVSGCDVEANAKGGLRFLTNDGGLSITGSYFEANADTTAGTFDIQLGFGSGILSAALVSANRFQGSSTDANYYPIRIKNADALVIEANGLGAGSRFCAFDTAVNITNSRFGAIHFGTGGADGTTGAGATYAGIPLGFVNQNNRIADDYVIPTDAMNLIAGDFPTGGSAAGWAATLAGSSTWLRSPNTGTVPDEHHGRPVGMLTRSGGTAIVTTGWVVSATKNARVRGRYVTFLVDVYVNNAAVKAFTVRLNDNAAQTYDLAAGSSLAAGWITYAVSGFFSTATTVLQVAVRGDDDAEFRIGNARVYVGLDASRMPGLSGDFVWYASAAPTTGTWADGDSVKNISPAAAGTPGWVCTTPGTGGGALVFKTRANVAA